MDLRVVRPTVQLILQVASPRLLPPCCRVFAEYNSLRVCDKALLSQGLPGVCHHATSQMNHASADLDVNMTSPEHFRAVSAVNPVRSVPAKACEV